MNKTDALMEQITILMQHWSCLIGILALLVTILIGWQLYQIIDFKKRIKHEIKSTLEKSILNNNKTIAACVHQLEGMMYAGVVEKDVTLAFKCYIDAIEELNDATNKEPLNGIISYLDDLVSVNPRLISITDDEYEQYSKICKKSVARGRLIPLLKLIKNNDKEDINIPKAEFNVEQKNKNGDNLAADKLNQTK